MEFRRRLYRRGSSFETTIPMPLLLTLNNAEQQDIVFSYDPEKQAWYVQFQPREEKDPKDSDARRLKTKKRGLV